MYSSVRVNMYILLHVHISIRTHGYVYTRLHYIIDVFGLDFPSLAMLRLVYLDTLFHHKFQKGTYGEAFLVNNRLHLIYKFHGADE